MRDLKKKPNMRSPQTKRDNLNVRKKQSRNWKELATRCTRLVLVVSCVVLVIAGAVLLIKVVVDSDHFYVATVEVTGNKRLADQEVIDLSDIRHGVSTFDLDLESIGQKLAESDWISSARIMRKLPQGIVIDITERQARFIINLDYLYYVDGDGEIFKVLRGGDSLDYPLVTGLERQQIIDEPQQTRQQLHKIALMLDDLSQREVFNEKCIAQINIEDHGRSTFYTDPYAVPIKMGAVTDIELFAKQVDRLEQIYISDIKKRLPVLEYIDLSVPDEIIVKTVSVIEKNN